MLFVDADCLLESSRLSRNHNAHEYAVEDADNQANPEAPLGPFAGFLRRLFGFLIAAPGAVYISGRNISGKDNGKISIAGPLVNMVLAVIGIAGCLLLNHSAFVVPFYLLMSLNGSLALFNMLPFPPLDGSKILAWDKRIYFVCLAISVLLFASFWLMPTLYWA